MDYLIEQDAHFLVSCYYVIRQHYRTGVNTASDTIESLFSASSLSDQTFPWSRELPRKITLTARRYSPSKASSPVC